jgi:cytochrome c oxidase subunit II
MLHSPARYREQNHRAANPSAAAGFRRRLRMAGVLGSLLLTSACVKPGISSKSETVHGLFYVILWLALPVFLFVEGMLLVSVVRFRRRRGDESEPVQNAGNNKTLAAFFAGPLAVIVVLLAVGEVAVARVDRNDPNPGERLVINAFQWEWSANYVNEGLSVTGKTLKQPLTMALPVDTPTRIELRSTDVIHEFYVPDLLYMKNAVPGHPNVFTVTPTKLGTYHGQCAQFCGLWHAQMTLVIKVVPQADFLSWVEQQKKAASTATCKPSGSTLELVAHQISWDKNCLAVLAGKPFQITIKNEDNQIDHDFAIWDSPQTKHQFYLTPPIAGPATKTFTIPALKPGKYYFQCNIHGPGMSGTLIVGGP